MRNRNDIINDLNYKYEQLRDKALTEYAGRRERLYAENPALPELDRQIRGVILERTRAIIDDDADKTEALEKKRIALQAEMNASLQKLGISDLAPRFRCKICQDTGYIGNERCGCYKNELFAALTEQANVSNIDKENFASFDAGIFPDTPDERGVSQRGAMIKLRDYLQRFCAEFPDTPPYNIILQGSAGLGKSFLLNCAAGAVLERNYAVLKLTAFALAELLRSYYLGNDEANVTLDDLLGVDLLIVDDLGAEPRYNNITVEYLFSIINERMQRLLHTLIATNLRPTDIISRYGERLFSRLSDRNYSRMIYIAGEDIRHVNRGDGG